MLDTDDETGMLSRYFVRKGMSDCSTSQLIDLLTDDDRIAIG
jgi:hypothetical protein